MLVTSNSEASIKKLLQLLVFRHKHLRRVGLAICLWLLVLLRDGVCAPQQPPEERLWRRLLCAQQSMAEQGE